MPTVFITGANRGIGLGLAKAFKAAGYDVIATARHPEKANDLKALEVEVHQLDVTDHAAIEALAETLKGRAIDILINNAGVLGGPRFNRDDQSQTFGTVDYEGLRYTLEINTLSPLKIAEAFLPNLLKGADKKLINITSRMGAINEMEAGYLAYRTSKAALNAVMRNVTAEVKGKGVTVAVLHPGWVRTDMGSSAAPLSVEDSVAGLCKVIYALDFSETGCFKNHLGETIGW